MVRVLVYWVITLTIQVMAASFASLHLLLNSGPPLAGIDVDVHAWSTHSFRHDYHMTHDECIVFSHCSALATNLFLQMACCLVCSGGGLMLHWKHHSPAEYRPCLRVGFKYH